MLREATAATVYASLVFVAGFALGALRTMIAAPLVGETAAVAIEAPLMLAISWFTCRATVADIPPTPGPRLRVGLLAFALLMIAELFLGVALGRSATDTIAALARPAGLIGLAAQAGFAAMPLLSAAWPRRSPRPRE